MTLGRIVNVRLMMPFWLIVLLGFIKPQVTLFLPGPPKLVSYLQLEDPENTEKGCIDTAKGEMGGILVGGLWLISACLDVTYIYKSLTMPGTTLLERFEEMFSSLAVSPNFGTLLCLTSLVALYGASRKDAPNPGQALVGKRLRVLHWLLDRTDEKRPLCTLLWSIPIIVCLLLQMAVGGIFERLDEEAVNMIPSRVQRNVVRVAFFIYKPIFHVMMVVALPAIFAYIWMFPLLMLAGGGATVLFQWITPRTVSLRRYLGASQQEIDAYVKHISEYDGAWSFYIKAPSLLSTILPIAIALSLRLMNGAGYFPTLRETWADRHLAVYLGVLLNKAHYETNLIVGIAVLLWTNLFAMSL